MQKSKFYNEPLNRIKTKPFCREKVVLIYRTEKDIEIAKEEQDEKLRTIASIRAGAIQKHAKSIKCAIRRLFGSTCPVCHNLSINNSPTTAIATTDASKISGSQKIEEGIVMDITSSVPTTIDTELESGLLGIVTTVDILNQISFVRQHLNIQHHDSGNLNDQQIPKTV